MAEWMKLRGIGLMLNTPDGAVVRFELDSEAGPIRLEAAPETAMEVARHMNQLGTRATGLAQKAAGHMAISAVQVDALTAGATAGSPVVMLSLRGTNGMVETYALTPDQTAKLMGLLSTAEPIARSYLKKTIQ
jgi:hypothetical protein